MRRSFLVFAAALLAFNGCDLPDPRILSEEWFGYYGPNCEDDEARRLVIDRDGLSFYESHLEVASEHWDPDAQEWSLDGALNEHGTRTPARFWIRRGPEGRSIVLSHREPWGGRSAPELLKLCSAKAPWR